MFSSSGLLTLRLSYTRPKNNPAPGALTGTEKSPPADRDWEGGFASKLMSKDLGLAMAAARLQGVPTPLGTLTNSIYEALGRNEEFMNKDFGVAFKALAVSSGPRVSLPWTCMYIDRGSAGSHSLHTPHTHATGRAGAGRVQGRAGDEGGARGGAGVMRVGRQKKQGSEAGRVTLLMNEKSLESTCPIGAAPPRPFGRGLAEVLGTACASLRMLVRLGTGGPGCMRESGLRLEGASESCWTASWASRTCVM